MGVSTAHRGPDQQEFEVYPFTSEPDQDSPPVLVRREYAAAPHVARVSPPLPPRRSAAKIAAWVAVAAIGLGIGAAVFDNYDNSAGYDEGSSRQIDSDTVEDEGEPVDTFTVGRFDLTLPEGWTMTHHSEDRLVVERGDNRLVALVKTFTDGTADPTDLLDELMRSEGEGFSGGTPGDADETSATAERGGTWRGKKAIQVADVRIDFDSEEALLTVRTITAGADSAVTDEVADMVDELREQLG